MIERTISSHDGISLRYAVSELKEGRQYLFLILPFGMKAALARHFLEFFEDHYNVVALETRSVVEPSDRVLGEGECVLENHLQDFCTVLKASGTDSAILLGYCSGAGVAIAIAGKYPGMVEQLILIHGEYLLFDEPGCPTTFSLELDNMLKLASQSEKNLYSVFSKIKERRVNREAGVPDEIELPFSSLTYFRRLVTNYMNYRATNFKEIARDVKARALFICGRLDIHTTVRSSELLSSFIAGSTVHIDSKADHYEILRKDASTSIVIWNYLCE